MASSTMDPSALASKRQYNTKNTAVKRIMQEARELANEKCEDYGAIPLEDNIFEWHFTIRGPSDSEFAGGIYHGRIILPPEYPFKPPSIILLTPNGRFEVGKKICLSISNYHPEYWQPSWSIRTVLVALIGFMPTKPEGAVGSLDYTPEERKALAAKSLSWVCERCGTPHNMLTRGAAPAPAQTSPVTPAPAENETASPAGNGTTEPAKPTSTPARTSPTPVKTNATQPPTPSRSSPVPARSSPPPPAPRSASPRPPAAPAAAPPARASPPPPATRASPSAPAAPATAVSTAPSTSSTAVVAPTPVRAPAVQSARQQNAEQGDFLYFIAVAIAFAIVAILIRKIVLRYGFADPF